MVGYLWFLFGVFALFEWRSRSVEQKPPEPLAIVRWLSTRWLLAGALVASGMGNLLVTDAVMEPPPDNHMGRFVVCPRRVALVDRRHLPSTLDQFVEGHRQEMTGAPGETFAHTFKARNP